MPNWPQSIITIIKNIGAGWTETNPALADVKFPWKVSRDFLVNPARRGPYKNMIWAVEARAGPKDPEYEGLHYCEALVNLYCYTRAVSDLEDDVKNGEIRACNLRDQVRKIIQSKKNDLTGAILMQPFLELPPLHEVNVNPVFYCRVLQIQVLYEET